MKKILIAFLFCAASVFAEDRVMPECNGTLIYHGKEYKWGFWGRYHYKKALAYQFFDSKGNLLNRYPGHSDRDLSLNGDPLDYIENDPFGVVDDYLGRVYPESGFLDEDLRKIIVEKLKECYKFYIKKGIFDIVSNNYQQVFNDAALLATFEIYDIMPDLLPDYY